jgi:polyhydroxybutyrate depolymerase
MCLWRAWRRWLLAALCGATLTAAAADELPAGHQRLTIEHGGLQRSAVLYHPKTSDVSAALPLVLMLHGMGGTAAYAVRETGWSDKATKEGFVVAYADASRPDATRAANFRKNPQAWNDGSGRFHAGPQRVDDSGFVRALIGRISATHRIDARRVYVTGFSNGASMTFKLGHELADVVAAIAPVSGASWHNPPQPARGLSLLYITGMADPLNPIEGGFPKLANAGQEQGGRAKPAVQEMILQWAEALKCQTGGLADTTGDTTADTTRHGVRTRRYTGCRDGGELMFVTVEGMGHVWAGGDAQLPVFLVGKATNKLNATDLIWDFFQKHPKP